MGESGRHPLRRGGSQGRYDVAGRYEERLEPGFAGTFRGKLAPFRFPETLMVFDDGTVEEVA